jgi:hypothetical protein
MFCQVCGSILDIRTAAFVNLGNHPETRRPGGTRTMWAGHLDADTTTGATHDVVTVREHLTREAARLGYTAMEIIDGREFTSRGVYRAAKHRERTEALLAAGTVE